VVKFLLILADSLQKLRVGGLTREELLHDLLDIGEASLGANLLESSLDFVRPRHLLVHLRLQEGTPELLSQEVLIHLQLVAVLVVAGSLITDLLLTIVTLVSALKSRLLIIE